MELSLESVRPEGELLAVTEPVGLHTMGVRAVRGATPRGEVADQATAGLGAVTGTVTNGPRGLAVEVGHARVHGWAASSGVGWLIQAGRGSWGGGGGRRTKRSGCAAWAAERTTARASRTLPARPWWTSAGVW